MGYKDYTQGSTADDLASKKSQIIQQTAAIAGIREKQAGVLAFLEERRKKDEAKYLKPVLAKLKEQEQNMYADLGAYREALFNALDEFYYGDETFSAEQLLEDYVYYKHLNYDLHSEEYITISMDKKAQQCLFDYFLEQEDVIHAAIFLRTRAGTAFSDKYDEERERYLIHITQHPTPLKASEVNCVDSDCILGYGEYHIDIRRLFEVCGKIDFKTKPAGVEGIYYSEQTNKLLAMASIGEFGQLCKHVYYDMPNCFGVHDSDRRLLMREHDFAYKKEQSIAETSEESGE